MSSVEGDKVTVQNFGCSVPAALDGDQAGLQASRSSNRNVIGLDHLGPMADRTISVDLSSNDKDPPKQLINEEQEDSVNMEQDSSNDKLVASITKLIGEIKILGTSKKGGRAKLSHGDMEGLLPLMDFVLKTAVDYGKTIDYLTGRLDERTNYEEIFERRLELLLHAKNSNKANKKESMISVPKQNKSSKMSKLKKKKKASNTNINNVGVAGSSRGKRDKSIVKTTVTKTVKKNKQNEVNSKSDNTTSHKTIVLNEARESDNMSNSENEFIMITKKKKKKKRNNRPTKGKGPNNQKILISLADGEDETEVKDKLQEVIKTNELNFPIRGLIKSRGGAIIITEKEADTQIFFSDAMKSAGLNAQVIEDNRPRVYLSKIDSKMKEEEIIGAIKRQNFEDNINLDIKLAFKKGPKEREWVGWVATCSPDTRRLLLAKKTISIGWGSCRISDYSTPSRCYKCQSYGHVSKHCKKENDTCRHCGVEGHKMEDCTKNTERAVCAACKKLKKPYDHSITSTKCYAFKRAKNRIIHNTRYV